MAIIRVHKNRFFENPIVHHEDFAVNLLDWLSDSDYHDLRYNGAVIRLNGVPMVDTTKQDAGEAEKRVDIMLGAFDEVDVIYIPEGLTATGWLILANVGLTIATYLLTPKVDQPEIDEQRTSNNQFNASRNRFRVREAIADLAGLTRIYPDFLQPSYWEYISNEQEFIEWFFVGVGRADVSSVRSGDTALSSIGNSSFNRYDITDFPATIKKATTVDELRDIPLPTEQDPSRFATVNGGTLDGLTGEINVGDSAITSSLALTNGSPIRITGTYFDLNTGVTETIDLSTTVISVSGPVITVAQFPNQSATDSWSGNIRNTSVATVSSWITLPDESDELIYNIELPRGLRDQGGGQISVGLTLSYQEVDANGAGVGVITSEFESISGNTPNYVRQTFKYAVPKKRYRVRASNASDYIEGALQDVVLRAVFGSSEYSTADFDDITIMRVRRRSNAGSGATASGDKINARAQRLLKLFDPTTGTFGTTYEATRSFAQYVMYLLVELGGVPLSKINYQELFAIENSLSNPELGYFDFSFDDKFQSLDSRIAECCDAARVKAYRVGGDYYRFVRDEQKSTRATIFNRRNLISGQASERFETYRAFDFDSIELEWINPIDNTPSYVRRRINPTTGAIESGTGERVNEFLFKGCQTESQAINRAEFEIRALKYRRKTVTDTATSEALNVGKGERVGYASIMKTDIFHGEVLEQVGNVFHTTEKFLPADGVTYYVMLLDADGNVSNSVVATAVEGNEFAFEAAGLTTYTQDGYEVQLGSLYVIAPDGKENAQDYILLSRGAPNAAGECAIELVNDDQRVYEMD